MSEEFINSSQMITKVFNNISNGDLEKNDKIQRAWKETLLKISGNGEKLAAHCSAVDLKNGVLLVESDHPGWNQTLQFHKKFILTGMNRLSGGVKIESLAFRVKGSQARLVDSDELAKKAVAQYARKIEAEQKKLEEMGYGKEKAAADASGKESLPPELNEIFERLKNSAK
mgnify:CR=1 FL=1